MEYNRKIDGYKVLDTQAEETEKVERLRDVTIQYYSNGEFFTSSPKYQKVPTNKVTKIKDKLLDYTLYNIGEESMASVIPLVTIINEVERIIYDKH